MEDNPMHHISSEFALSRFSLSQKSFFNYVAMVVAVATMAIMALQPQAASAVEVCELPTVAGEWDLADNATIDIDIAFDVGDVATDAYSVTNASVDITHTYAGDLGGRLLSPDGTNIHLWQLGDGSVSPSTPTASSCSEGGYELDFVDGAVDGNLVQSNEGSFCIGANIDSLTSGTGGTGDPYVFSRTDDTDIGIQGTADPIDALSSFVGDQVAGNWTMRIQDSYGGDEGTINEVCLDLTFAGVEHEFFVSENATCTDAVEEITVDDGDTVYVCQNVVNKGTETFEVKTSDHSNDLGTTLTALEGSYAVRDAVGDSKSVINSFTAGGSEFPIGVSTYNSDVTVTGTDANFTASDTLNPMRSVTVTVSEVPPVTDANISVNAGSGTGSTFVSGDQVVVTWDASAAGDEQAFALTGATADLSGWGGSATAAMTDTTACGGTAADDIYEACFTLVDGSIDTTGVTTSVNATNVYGSSGSIADTGTSSVDNQSPTVTAGNLVADESACTGTGGACIVGDTITFTWDNSGSGDNNPDISGVTVDLSDFGGSATQMMHDDGTNGDSSSGDDIYTYSYTVVADDDDGTNTFSATATDDAGESNTPTTSTDTAVVDNIVPTLSETIAVTTPSSDDTPSYKFTSSEAGTISVSGGCNTTTTAAISGGNTINLDADGAGTGLANATYASCTVTVTDAAGNESTPLSITSFEVDTSLDTDGDGVPDVQELIDGTSISDPADYKDTDGDGVPDYVETNVDGTDPNDGNEYKDSDGDGVSDAQEALDGTDEADGTDYKDTDGDGHPDYVETLAGSDKADDGSVPTDTDGDGVPDVVEVLQGTDENDNTDYADVDGDGHGNYVENVAGSDYSDEDSVPTDTDGDGVSDIVEVLDGTDPNDEDDYTDGDGDGVPDYVESGEGTDADDINDVTDGDGDGVPDHVETVIDGTNPEDATEYKDSDEDGHPDHVENLAGSNPASSDSVPTDTDEDGIPDVVENQQGSDLNDPTDSQDTDNNGVPDYLEGGDTDSDGDGVPDTVEILDGTDPDTSGDFTDEDGDGHPDYVEELDGSDEDSSNSVPTDTDGDGIPDVVEEANGMDADDPMDFIDTDGDGVGDYLEVLEGTDPTDASSVSKQIARHEIRHKLIKPKRGKAEVGDTVTYRVRVINTGNVSLDTVKVVEKYNKKNLKYKSSTVEPYYAEKGKVRWANILGDDPLEAGERRNVKVKYTVKDVPTQQSKRKQKLVASTKIVEDVSGRIGNNKNKSNGQLRLKKQPKDVTYQLYIINELGEEITMDSDKVRLTEIGKREWKVEFEDNVDYDFNDLSVYVKREPMSTVFTVTPLQPSADFNNQLGIRLMIDGEVQKEKIIYSTSLPLETDDLLEQITDIGFKKIL